MPGGSFCCMIGCSASSHKCRGLSFHGFPKKGLTEASDKWRGHLIVKVARSDARFNPDTAKICSRHFEETCLVTKPSGRRVLVPGSLPTLFIDPWESALRIHLSGLTDTGGHLEEGRL